MIKSRTQTYADVRSFLNKDKSSKSFVSYTVGRKVFLGVRVFLISLAMLLLLYALFGGSTKEFVAMGVTDAHPFSAAKRKYNLLDKERVLISSISPLILKKEEPKEQKEKSEPPTEPDITAKKVVSDGIDIKNETDYNIDIPTLLGEKIALDIQNPKVLIVHTHGSESYTSSPAHKYTASGNFRTQDTKFNVVRVGEEIEKHLKKKGIEVIHDRTINDYPSYNDSYNKTGDIIARYIEADKDIAFVLDIHRDAIGEGDNIVKFVSEVKGRKSAQVMMVCGTDVNLEHPHWRENLKLAVHIQAGFETEYPGFLRPINLRKERFNMHLTTGSILFEIGTNGNTLDEALVAAKFLGEGLGDIINNLCGKY